METPDEPTMRKIYESAANGDAEAMAFLVAMDDYFKAADAFMALEPKSATEFLHLLARTNAIFSSPFYQNHCRALYMTVQQAFAEWCYPMEDIVFAVACIKVGFERARELWRAERRESSALAQPPPEDHVSP